MWCPGILLQPAIVTAMQDAAGSTWNCTNCPAECQVEFVWSVDTSQRVAIATTAKKVTTEIWQRPSPIAKLVKVSWDHFS